MDQNKRTLWYSLSNGLDRFPQIKFHTHQKGLWHKVIKECMRHAEKNHVGIHNFEKVNTEEEKALGDVLCKHIFGDRLGK